MIVDCSSSRQAAIGQKQSLNGVYQTRGESVSRNGSDFTFSTSPFVQCLDSRTNFFLQVA